MLLLDEPTNHLDAEMIAWLEEYLREFRGTVLMVTHDRYFLDRVTNRILEISHGQMYSYPANYSQFLEMKDGEREKKWNWPLRENGRVCCAWNWNGPREAVGQKYQAKEPDWNVWKR